MKTLIQKSDSSSFLLVPDGAAYTIDANCFEMDGFVYLYANENLFDVVVCSDPPADWKTTKYLWSNNQWTLNENFNKEDFFNPLETDEAKKVREQRNNLLSEYDWLVSKSFMTGEPIPEPITSYCQALRDITNHVNFPFLKEEDWPVKPA